MTNERHTEPIIRVEDLTVAYGDFTVLSDVSFEESSIATDWSSGESRLVGWKIVFSASATAPNQMVMMVLGSGGTVLPVRRNISLSAFADAESSDASLSSMPVATASCNLSTVQKDASNDPCSNKPRKAASVVMCDLSKFDD